MTFGSRLCRNGGGLDEKRRHDRPHVATRSSSTPPTDCGPRRGWPSCPASSTCSPALTALPGGDRLRRRPEAARASINAWVGDSTSGKIRELFPAGTIATNTALVLVNALYLDAPWKYKFDVTLTRPPALPPERA